MNKNFEVNISVVIPTHGRPKLLSDTLSSIAKCTLPQSYNKLLVVENGSQAGAEAVVRQLPQKLNAEYLYTEWGNKSNALNIALEKLDEDLVIFADDDVKLSPNTLVAYAEVAEGYKSGVFFGGPVLVDREEDPPEWLEHSLPYSARGYDLVNDRMESGYLGFNWAAFTPDIKKLGGFNPDFGPGSPTGATGQESDMQERMRKAGMKEVDVLDAVVWHKVPKSRCNEQWVKRRYFKYGKTRGVKAHTWRAIVFEAYNMIKYSIRWLIYLLLFNKSEKKKSKMLIITGLGFFEYIFSNSKND